VNSYTSLYYDVHTVGILAPEPNKRYMGAFSNLLGMSPKKEKLVVQYLRYLSDSIQIQIMACFISQLNDVSIICLYLKLQFARF
jgi:hypothetical protein